MKKKTDLWSVRELEKHFKQISFPEYQREPNVWGRVAKQRLVDSMVRQFDIASLYLYFDEDQSIDCIDGRQRIGAIMSFLGENPEDQDNGFEFRLLNEIYTDEDQPFAALDGLTFAALVARSEGDPLAKRFLAAIRDSYELTIVRLSGSRRPEEFNLQFTRLNLGTIINSGEKLHAMVGELRDACFAEGGLGQHPFLELTRIPIRRFAKEQTAAQILAQIFSLEGKSEFTRTRHFDLQRLFKEHGTLSQEQRKWVDRTREILDLLEKGFVGVGPLRNRSITVSAVLLAWQLKVKKEDEAIRIAKFIDEFTCRLKWQVRKNLDVDDEYRYLVDFQRHLTQASVEKAAVTARADALREEFIRWDDSGSLKGDQEFKHRTHIDPSEACRAA